jgi:hypothetical protein
MRYVVNPRGSVKCLSDKDAASALTQPGWHIVTDKAKIEQGYLPEYDKGDQTPVASVTAELPRRNEKIRTEFTTVIV